MGSLLMTRSRLVLVTAGFLALGLAVHVRAQAPRQPTVWALVVGIDKHEDERIPSCTSAERDARLVAGWFRTTGGWSEANLLHLDFLGAANPGKPGSNTSRLRPTRSNLNWAIDQWLGSRVQKKDLVVVYYAGQAIHRPSKDETSPSKTYLVPIDARLGDVEKTGLLLDECLDRIKRRVGDDVGVVVWLDTSTQGRGPQARRDANQSPKAGETWLRSLTRWPGVSAWLAADGQVASEPNESGPGPFVSALFRSLGSRDSAHNLLGTLDGLQHDPSLLQRGFKTQGGVPASWSTGPGFLRRLFRNWWFSRGMPTA